VTLVALNRQEGERERTKVVARGAIETGRRVG
jgi:hypothetical protein